MSPRAERWLGALRAALRRLRQGAHLAVGLPDYEQYLAHRRLHHPGEPVLPYAAFFRERQAARYRRGASRCC